MTQATALRVQAFTTGDVAAQCSATPGWVQQYQQMSPGHFAGHIRYLDLQGVQVYEECMNTRVEQHFNDAFAVNNKHRCQSAEMQHDGEEKSAVRYAEDFLKQQEMTAA